MHRHLNKYSSQYYGILDDQIELSGLRRVHNREQKLMWPCGQSFLGKINVLLLRILLFNI